MPHTTTFWGENVLPLQDLEQLPHTHTVMGVWVTLTTLENCLLVSTKAEQMYILWFSNFTPRYIPNINVYTYTHAPKDMYKFIAALSVSIIVTYWEQLKCPATAEQVNKLWYIPMMEFYKAIRMNKFLLYATMWMNLTNNIEQKKPDIKRYVLYHYIYMRFKQATSIV